ncbi:beta-ketoacyl synthase N-terminal-like domain-containing protein [Streptomyces bohaiensis]|uniref:Ketosynthase family 3 (KS3) domain-containing protein n=2 Tax=Streptomyces bohaiensis TaxID=1431344 RepID=A0ABX1CAW5_9ACTN|nr:beta-ketoacyl synthase N-terminal-like domain-containing protein [Streptomyces bohaiensis]NJQ14289.1 hypothetical protein [Streptomyces bohaiensis]
MSTYAIVGLSCLFPGARTPNEFWDNLRSGTDSRREGGAEVFGSALTEPAADPAHRIRCARGGFVSGFRFDPSGYRLDPAHLSRLDRLFHWTLHTGREALRDSGHADRPDILARTALVLGNYSFPTPSSAALSLPLVHENVLHGLTDAGVTGLRRGGAAPPPPAEPATADNARVSGAPAAVTAAALGLGGPRYALDAACSSTLYALKLACDHLESGEADLALAGGVSAPDPTLIHLSFSDLHAYPEDGFSQPFDTASGGILTGQGAGMLAVRRLPDALAAGERIYAVIDGIGLSNDGTGRHLLVPHAAGQHRAYELAYEDAGLSPSRVDYLECHATGTPVGDRTESETVTAFFGDRGRVPLLGSVKGNIGHLLTVAGLSSLIKVVLAAHHGHIPPTIGVTRPQTALPEGALVREGRSWPVGDGDGTGPRHAAVSAFGFGGTNAHVVLSVPQGTPQPAAAAPSPETAPGTEPNPAPHTGPDPAPHLDITGIGAHFGPLTTAWDVERAQFEGTDVLGPLPARRWRGLETTPDGTLAAAGLTPGSLPPGAFVASVDVDPVDQRIPPSDLGEYNLQHALISEVAEEALRDAGYSRAPAEGEQAPAARRIGVVIAMEIEPSAHLHLARYGLGSFLREVAAATGVDLSEDELAGLAAAAREGVHRPIVANEVLSYIGNIMTSRISSLWNFTGPSFTLSAGEAGTAEALRVARSLLREPATEAVLVGAVDLAASPESLLLRTARGDGPASGPGLSFGEGSRGWRIGEGAGAVVLTRADDPDRPRPTAYGRLEAVEIGYAAPVDGVPAGADPALLAETARRALRVASAEPADIGYLEAHADGDDAADRAELDALAEVYPRGAAEVALGSAGAQFGRTGAAAGMAGLLRAVLSAHHGYLPGTPTWTRPAADLADAFDRSALYVPDSSRPWLRRTREGRRRAAVSFLGAGGIHGHLVLSSGQHPAPRPSDWQRAGGPLLLPLGAEDLPGLLTALEAARADLTGTTGVDPWETARRAAADLPADAALRCVLVGRNGSQLLAQLDRALADLPAAHAAGGEWSTPAGSYFTASPIGPDAKVALVYPGAVNTYPGLGRDLFRAFPALRDTFERETADPDRAFRTAELYPRGTTAPTRRELMRHEAALSEDLPFMLATGTTFAILHTDLVREILGVPAHGAFGYSLGESSMLFATGGWHRSARRDDRISATPLFRDRLCGPRRTVREAWGLPEETADSEVWACHVLLGDADRVRAALTGYDKVFLTHVNTPTETVVAGDPDQCRQLIAALGCQAARSPVNAVMHCPPVDAEVDGLAELNDHRTGDPGGLELLSAYDYGPIADLERGAVARRIARTLRSTIDFPRLVDAAHQRGYRYFIEVGPSATCTRWVRETLGDRPHLAVAVDRRGADTVRPLAELVARLVAHGLPVRLSALLAPAGPSARPSRRRFAVGGGAPVAAAVTEAVRPVLAARSAVTARHPAVAAARSAAPLAPVAPSVPALSEENAPMPTDPTLSEPEVMTFDGDPVAVLPWAAPESSPEPSPDAATPGTAVAPVVAAATAAAPPVPRAVLPVSPASPGYAAADLVRELRRQMVDTHQVVMETQQVLQQAALGQVLDTLGAPTPAPSAPAHALPAAPSPAPADRSAAPTVPAPQEAPRAADAAPGGRRDTAGTPDAVDGPNTTGGPVWNEQELLAFATGSVADVFGAAFAPVDSYGKRVRLPAPPYHFVTRVTAIDAVPGEFKPSTITTEYDVPEDAWYAVDGGVPPAVAIEAGQCDLLLISYLGIDFRNQGRRVYRLLDSTLVFHGDLPTTGQTLRYDISIDRFVHQGEVTLFFFSYLCYADGELILELKDACAGFFSEEELESPLGVVETARDRAEREALTRTWFKPLARTTRDHLTSADLDLLAQGRPGDVFGPDHGQDPGLNPALRLPDARLRMADEITVDRTGGPRGLGALTAVKRLEPDAWYFTCHFPDDPVLAGSLVAEGAVQILQTYLLHQGMHLVLPDARFQTVVGLRTSVQVRGQITPRDREIRYEVEVRELTLLPRPTVVADVRVHLGDKPVIRMRNFGIQIREKDGTPYRPEKGGVPAFLGRRNRAGEPAMINELHLAHAAKGDLGTAMGPEFDIYAASRAPYIPNGDFQFVDRIMSLTGVRGDFSGTPEMVTEYDSPPDAWYYTHNAHPHMPNCVYMETSLQAAILLGYYLGATLETPGTEYAIRNLDGTATLVKDLDLRGRTVRHHSTLLMTSAISGAVLQKFSYELSADGEVFYRGESLFGYFSESALANQVGLDGGRRVPSWLESEAPDASRVRRITPSTDADADADTDAGTGGPRLPGGHFDLVDHVDLVDDGGRYGRGYLHGERAVRPDEWYFSCHFHRDPVMPGSLGVEAILQALRLYTVDRGLANDVPRPRFAPATDIAMSWKYRGQILRDDGRLTFDVHVKEVRRTAGRVVVVADADLSKNGMRIYELTDVAIEVRSED